MTRDTASRLFAAAALALLSSCATTPDKNPSMMMADGADPGGRLIRFVPAFLTSVSISRNATVSTTASAPPKRSVT